MVKQGVVTWAKIQDKDKTRFGSNLLFLTLPTHFFSCTLYYKLVEKLMKKKMKFCFDFSLKYGSKK
jgi:hypothetical protein